MNRALKKYDIVRKDIENDQIPSSRFPNGSTRSLMHNRAESANLDSCFGHRQEQEEIGIPRNEPLKAQTQKIPKQKTKVRTDNQESISEFMIRIDESDEWLGSKKIMAQEPTNNKADIVLLENLLLSYSVGESIHFANQCVDATTAKSVWFLNEADLLMVEGNCLFNGNVQYHLHDIIQRSLRKYGHASLLKMIKAKKDPSQSEVSFHNVDKAAQIQSFYLKARIDKCTAGLKNQVCDDLIMRLEAKAKENAIELEPAEKDRTEKSRELHLERHRRKPCPLRLQARQLRFDWSDAKVKKLEKDRTTMQTQIRCLQAIRSEKRPVHSDVKVEQSATRRVFADSTNKKTATPTIPWSTFLGKK